MKFELTLVPNKDSVFGGYSAKYFRQTLPDYPGMKTVGEEQVFPGTYIKPTSASRNPFDYIFKLDGYLYQMPFPAKELVRGGWTFYENGKLDQGDRVLLHASKKGEKISLGLWNHNTCSSDYEDCAVVWLKTGTDNRWAQVDFDLMDGAVRNGMQEASLKSPVTCRWYSGIPASYTVTDPLYNSVYGYEIYPEDQRVAGVTVGYAPNPYDRRQRLDLLTGRGWEHDPVMQPPYDTDLSIQLNRIYKIDLDGDGRTEDIDVRFLDGVGIADNGILCVIVDGQVTASVVGATDRLSDDIHVNLSLRGKTAIMTVDGYDAQSNDIHKEIQLKKDWSEVLVSTVSGEPDQSGPLTRQVP